MIIYPTSYGYKQIIHNEKITIKFEIDINPPAYANTELKYRLLPFPYQIRLYDKESLFAGKIHKVLSRSWKRRVKGIDLYDYIYYLSSNTNVNLKHLEARLKQTLTIKEDTLLIKDLLIKILNNRFDEIDYRIAKEDVFSFIKDTNSLDLWSSNFLKSITDKLKVI